MANRGRRTKKNGKKKLLGRIMYALSIVALIVITLMMVYFGMVGILGFDPVSETETSMISFGAGITLIIMAFPFAIIVTLILKAIYARMNVSAKEQAARVVTGGILAFISGIIFISAAVFIFFGSFFTVGESGSGIVFGDGGFLFFGFGEWFMDFILIVGYIMVAVMCFLTGIALMAVSIGNFRALKHINKNDSRY